MRGYMFRNRWFALLFVAIVLASVTRIVGTGKGDGALDGATRQIAQTQDRAEEMTGPAPARVAEDVTIQWTPDEELIDPATGDDPTPVDEFAEQQKSPAGTEEQADTEVIIVSSESVVEGPTPGL